MTNLPAPRPRRTLPEIAAVSWEHPADRAALQALRAIPGVDEVIRKVLALLGGERGIRLLFQGNAVRVGPVQFPSSGTCTSRSAPPSTGPTCPSCTSPRRPSSTPGRTASDEPFIVIHSAAIELLDDDELRVLLSHELGHVMSGHALYRTIAAILALISLGALPMLAGIALLPVKLAFLEWSPEVRALGRPRRSARRQDVVVAQRLDHEDGRRRPRRGLHRRRPQRRRLHGAGPRVHRHHEGLDIVYKVLNTLGLTHPMHTVRAAELQKWVASGDYDRILRGEYVRRGARAKERPIGDDWRAPRNTTPAKRRLRPPGGRSGAPQAAEKAAEAFRNAQKRLQP